MTTQKRAKKESLRLRNEPRKSERGWQRGNFDNCLTLLSDNHFQHFFLYLLLVYFIVEESMKQPSAAFQNLTNPARNQSM